MMLGDPHVVDPGFLRRDRGRDGPIQHRGVILAGKPRGQQEYPEPHRRCPT